MLLSLRLSCRSELTRQGTSLSVVTTSLNSVPHNVCGALTKRVDHFCQPLYVAIQLGLSLQLKLSVAWRIVSEDFEQIARPFLLIVCTERIVTCQNKYRRILRVSSIWPSFTKASVSEHNTIVNLRTVIVTAAVYRGFGRQLLPKDNRLP